MGHRIYIYIVTCHPKTSLGNDNPVYRRVTGRARQSTHRDVVVSASAASPSCISGSRVGNDGPWRESGLRV